MRIAAALAQAREKYEKERGELVEKWCESLERAEMKSDKLSHEITDLTADVDGLNTRVRILNSMLKSKRTQEAP